MTYVEFNRLIHSQLQKRSQGMTWKELKESLDLPYDRPCPEWVSRLEKEIGLVRAKGAGKAFVWRVANGTKR